MLDFVMFLCMESIVESSQTQMETEQGRSLSALSVFILGVFDEAVRFRQQTGMDAKLLACKYAACGEYTPEEKAKRAAQGLPMVYAPLSDTKRRAACAWAAEIFLNTAEKPYELHPTPVPDMPETLVEAIAAEVVREWASVVSPNPPQSEEELAAVAEIASRRRDEIENLVREDAERRAKRLDTLIHDRMTEGRWREEMTLAIEYAATYGTAVVKLIHRKREHLKRKVNKFGVSTFSIGEETKLELKAIDPLDCYPSKGAIEIGDGYFCQRVRYQVDELSSMIGGKHCLDDALREVLMMYHASGYRSYQDTDSEREELDNDGPTVFERGSTIKGVEFFGKVFGDLLIQEGVKVDADGKDLKRETLYYVDAIVVANRVVYCEIADKRIGFPVFKGKFYSIPGSWWGESPVSKMQDVQRIANGALTSLVWNMGMASGPQIVITDVERLVNKDLRQRPWAVHLFKRSRVGGANDMPMKFFQPGSNANELLGVYDRMGRDADVLTGIPAYSYGSDVAAGAGRTASGLSMLMDAAQRGMKHFCFSFDLDLMRPLVQYFVNYEMLNNPDEGVKGDVVIDSGGLLAILSKDKSSAMLKEVLALCQNPLVANVIGEDGISELMRRIVSLIPHINPDRIVPTREELEFRKLKQQLEQLRMQQAQAMMAQGAQGAGAIAPSDSGARATQLVDGVSPNAAMGGQAPGSTFNQYQPNRAPSGDAEVMA